MNILTFMSTIDTPSERSYARKKHYFSIFVFIGSRHLILNCVEQAKSLTYSGLGFIESPHENKWNVQPFLR